MNRLFGLFSLFLALSLCAQLSFAKLVVYDLLGREVKVLVNER